MLSFLLSVIAKVFCFTGAVEKGSFPHPLSKEEEAKTLALALQGDKEAKDKLIRHNMRLVAHIAKKYAGAADPDDILSVGSIGLIKAIDTYRPDKGTALATYTARCIENEILMLLRAGKKHRSNVSLTDPVGMDKDGNELTIMDVLAEEGDVFDSVENSILSQHLLSAMKEHLSEREFEVISLRYGFGCAPLPQREVAKKLGISRSYVSRIEKRAMEVLRASLREEDFLAD